MEEKEVVDCIKGYFFMRDYEVDGKEGYSDIIAVKGAEKWVVEAKGDRTNSKGHVLVDVIGQIIRDMEDRKTFYAIGIPSRLVDYFKEWGEEGIKSLPPIHLLLVGEDGIVKPKTPDEFKAILLRKKVKNTFRIVSHGLRHYRKQ